MENMMLRVNRVRVYRCNATILLAVIAIGSGAGTMAQGQARYEVMPVPEVFLKAERKIESGMPREEREDLVKAISTRGTLERQVNNILRGSPPNALQDDPELRRVFDGWYAQYYFAILTHPSHLANWPEKRQKFLKMMAATMPPDVHEHLVDLARQTMLTIVKGNFHPVARYNAMLLIGHLNTKEASLIGDKSPPIPHIQGLVDALAEFENPKQIDAVRVAAMVGVLRHVVIDGQLADGARRLVGRPGEERIVSLMLGLVDAKTLPKGRTQAGHDWMRRRAVEILGALGSIGENGKVVTALQGILGDEKAPVSLRCSAAEAMGRINYPQNTPVKVADVAKSMGAVAAHACYDEIRRVEAQQEREEGDQDPALGGSGTESMYGGPATGAFGTLDGVDALEPHAYRIALTRRRIKYRTLSVQTGWVGEKKEERPRFPSFSKPKTEGEGTEASAPKKRGILALAKSKEDEDYVQKVATHVDAIIGQADDASFKDLTSLVTEIRKKVQSLEHNCGIVVSVD